MAKEKGPIKPCKTCEEKMEDSFIESIGEEIRNENWQILWNKYGKFVTYASCALIIGVSVYSMWQRQDTIDREVISSKFSAVQNMLMTGNTEQALPQIRELANVSKKDYATLAKLEYAAALRNKGDKGALDQYKSISQDEKVNVLIKDLAYIFYVNSSLDMMSTKDILSSIDGFIKELSSKYINGPWALIAKESLAFCYIKLGKIDLAKEALESLLKTTGIPASMAERARILLQTISR